MAAVSKVAGLSPNAVMLSRVLQSPVPLRDKPGRTSAVPALDSSSDGIMRLILRTRLGARA